MKILNPSGWPRPKGYSNGIAARGTLVFIAGTVGWNPRTEKFESTDFVDQFKQALLNIREVMTEAGALPEHMTKMTWYLTDKGVYLSRRTEVGAAYREVMGKIFPAMAVVEINGLMEQDAKIEIEAVCVIPDNEPPMSL